MKKRRYSERAWTECQRISAALARYKPVILALRQAPNQEITLDDVYRMGLVPEDFQGFAHLIDPKKSLDIEIRIHIKAEYETLCGRAGALFRRKTSKKRTRTKKVIPRLDVGYRTGKKSGEYHRACIRVRSRQPILTTGIQAILDRTKSYIQGCFRDKRVKRLVACYFDHTRGGVEQNKTKSPGVMSGALGTGAFTCHVTTDWIRFAFIEGLVVIGGYIIHSAKPQPPDTEGNRVWAVEFVGLGAIRNVHELQYVWAIDKIGTGRVVQDASGLTTLHATTISTVVNGKTNPIPRAPEEQIAAVLTPHPIGAPRPPGEVEGWLVLLDALTGFEAPTPDQTAEIWDIRAYWQSRVGQTELPGGSAWWVDGVTNLLGVAIVPYAKKFIAYLEEYGFPIPNQLRQSAETQSWDSLRSLAKGINFGGSYRVGSLWPFVGVDAESRGANRTGLAAVPHPETEIPFPIRGAEVDRIAELPTALQRGTATHRHLALHYAGGTSARNHSPLSRIPSRFDLALLNLQTGPLNPVDHEGRITWEVPPASPETDELIRRYLAIDIGVTEALLNTHQPPRGSR